MENAIASTRLMMSVMSHAITEIGQVAEVLQVSMRMDLIPMRKHVDSSESGGTNRRMKQPNRIAI